MYAQWLLVEWYIYFVLKWYICFLCIYSVKFCEKIDFSHLFIFLGGSDIASIVINESEAEGEEARKFLEDVRVTFPQVCEFNCPYLFF